MLPKSERFRLLAQWLVDEYGLEWLQQNGGVLDVAGGKGILAQQLAQMEIIQCTVVDPYDRRQGAKQRQGGKYQQICEEFNSGFVLRHREMIADVAVLVGLHPDQPTGDICDFALQMGKPFVVVPCCSYTHLFPGRRLANGSSVETTNQLVEFIKQKDPARVHAAYLNFEGRNKVLYTKPTKL